MHNLTTTEISGLADASVASMTSLVQVGALSAVGELDDYNRPMMTFTYSQDTPAGYKPLKGSEVMERAEVGIVDAVFRLPLGTAIRATGRLKLVSRLGVQVDPPQYFNVIGAPQIGTTCILVNARTVTLETP